MTAAGVGWKPPCRGNAVAGRLKSSSFTRIGPTEDERPGPAESVGGDDTAKLIFLCV